MGRPRRPQEVRIRMKKLTALLLALTLLGHDGGVQNFIGLWLGFGFRLRLRFRVGFGVLRRGLLRRGRGVLDGGLGRFGLVLVLSAAGGLDDYMVTVDEFNKILDSCYANDYVLVDIGSVWSETAGEDGTPVMVRNTLYLPEGKKPLILSYDDTNYYPYMLENGFTYKLILDEDGRIASWGLNPQGEEVVSRELDAIPALDKFVEEHPDFSPFGAKASLSLTGYEGILGYRTQTDGTVEWTDGLEAARGPGCPWRRRTANTASGNSGG